MAPKKNYTPEDMAKAIEDVKRGVAVATAAKNHSVPRITLRNKVTGKSPAVCSMGPSTILSPTEETISAPTCFLSTNDINEKSSLKTTPSVNTTSHKSISITSPLNSGVVHIDNTIPESNKPSTSLSDHLIKKKNILVPSPFKKALFWPEIDNKRKRKVILCGGGMKV